MMVEDFSQADSTGTRTIELLEYIAEGTDKLHYHLVQSSGKDGTNTEALEGIQYSTERLNKGITSMMHDDGLDDVLNLKMYTTLEAIKDGIYKMVNTPEPVPTKRPMPDDDEDTGGNLFSKGIMALIAGVMLKSTRGVIKGIKGVFGLIPKILGKVVNTKAFGVMKQFMGTIKDSKVLKDFAFRYKFWMYNVKEFFKAIGNKTGITKFWKGITLQYKFWVYSVKDFFNVLAKNSKTLQAVKGVANTVKNSKTVSVISKVFNGIARVVKALKPVVTTIGKVSKWVSGKAIASIAKVFSMIAKPIKALMNVSRIFPALKLMGRFTKVIPVVGQIITGIMAFFEGITGFLNADEISGKAKEALTLGDKIQASIASILSGLTLGFVSAQSFFKGIDTAMTWLKKQFIYGVEILDRVLHGDIGAIFEPLIKIFDWLSNLTVDDIIPDKVRDSWIGKKIFGEREAKPVEINTSSNTSPEALMNTIEMNQNKLTDTQALQSMKQPVVQVTTPTPQVVVEAPKQSKAGGLSILDMGMSMMQTGVM